MSGNRFYTLSHWYINVSNGGFKILNYRAEIDGLRAIAVVSVILYHAKIVIFGRDWFEGGFIGVDIFFVISGYLITRIILTELEETNTFSFTKFYERRARRILPMLFLVVAVCIPFAWQKLLPLDLVDFAKSALSAIGFGSNFFFYYSTTEYGTDSALLKPLLHTWSLAVEEQFYIIVPIIILVIWKFARTSLLTLLIGMLLMSIQFADYMEARDSEFNFFLPFSRFWELLIGFALAFIELKYGRSKNPILTQTLPIIGLFLIAHSILFFDAKIPHPSFHTLIPIMGVALVLAFCSTEDFVGKLLSFKPIVGIGLISYSLYLWHFPIFAFGRIGTSNPSTHDKLEWIVIAFFLSILSFHLCEKKFRRVSFISIKKLSFTLICFVIVSCSFFLLTIQNDGFKQRLPYVHHEESFNGRYLFWDTYNRCHQRIGSQPDYFDFCELGISSNKKVYVVGDSHTSTIAFRLFKYLQEQETSLVLMTRPNAVFGRNKKLDLARIKVLEDVTDSVVVFGGFAHREKEEFFTENRNHYENLLSKLHRQNNKVVFVYPIPSTDIHRVGFLDEFQKNGFLKDKKSDYDEFNRESALAFEFYDTFKQDNIYRIYPHQFLCNGSDCFGVREGEILMRDSTHPSAITDSWIVSRMVSLGVFSH